MKKILGESTAYQSIVEQFEEKEENKEISLLSRRILLETKKVIY